MKNQFYCLILICILLFTLFSCSTYRTSYMVLNNIKKVELDMSKKEIVEIMGKTYVPISMSKENGISYEVIGYQSLSDSDNYLYLFYFIDGKLERWQKEWVGNPYNTNEQSVGESK